MSGTDEKARVRVEIEGHVARVVLDRAEKRNAVDGAMTEAIVAAGERIARDRSIRAVVLQGEGDAFCAGLDVASFGPLAAGTGPNLFARTEASPANLAQRVAWIWQEIDVPVIAAIHGFALGAGYQLAAGADIRIARPDAQLSIMEIAWGLIPDMGLTVTALRHVPEDVLKELTFTGRVVNGEEAKALGLVTRVVEDPAVAAMDLAKTIATKSPDAVRAAKRLFRDVASLDVRGRLEREAELQLALIGTKNQVEAVQANLEKRAPVFED